MKFYLAPLEGLTTYVYRNVYMIDLLVSQSSALMPLHSKAGYQSAGGHL